MSKYEKVESMIEKQGYTFHYVHWDGKGLTLVLFGPREEDYLFHISSIDQEYLKVVEYTMKKIMTIVAAHPAT